MMPVGIYAHMYLHVYVCIYIYTLYIYTHTCFCISPIAFQQKPNLELASSSGWVVESFAEALRLHVESGVLIPRYS